MFAHPGPRNGSIGVFLGKLSSLPIHLYVVVLSRLLTPQKRRVNKLGKAIKHRMGHMDRVRSLQSDHAVLWAHMTG
jgi:hypothetical protein